MTVETILVSALPFSEFDPTPLERLQDAGFKVVLAGGGTPEWNNALGTAIGMIAGVETLGTDELRRAKRLKVLSRCGTGMDNVDQQEAQNLGIIVRNTPDAPTQAVAEITLGLVLNLLRGIGKADREIRSGLWSPFKGTLLKEKTIGIVGLGRIGRRFAELLEPFQTQILAFEPRSDLDFITRRNVRLVHSLDNIFRYSDIISLHLPYSTSVHHIINGDLLSLMKPNAFLVNTARGLLVDEKALLEKLSSNQIGGAALDTFEEEPYKGPLTGLNNVVLTSHMASYARESRVQMEIESVNNLLTVFESLNQP